MDYEKVVCEAAEYIHAHHGDEISVADVAQHVYLSPSYCATVFRTLTGFTVQEYLSRYRLFQVARALLETDERIVALTLRARIFVTAGTHPVVHTGLRNCAGTIPTNKTPFKSLSFRQSDIEKRI